MLGPEGWLSWWVPPVCAPQMAKSGLSLEVDCGELGGRILTALRAERWRTRAEAALRTPSKTTGAGSAASPHGLSRHCSSHTL